ncbi:TonB-dependent receptor [Reichenbachiella sp. MSK19-1]|uniref:TonB-dependent receptor n=1 Tax=Reichenbachiella sp. MSK19-1 TaxID=1897631 RepID=UPI000E6CAD4A|nr:TonB-dependent receptor [Reichenbachiella sp. MSK19-1]RJE74589.1 TonB-dependent receptor [Reichenbachiella sp. MSK19-1]
MTKRTYILLVVIYLLATVEALASDQLYNGTVRDEKGKALPGATILSDLGEGVVTDPFGKFKIKISDEAKYLTVSFIGYEMQQVALVDQTSGQLVITMQPSSISLSNVVITPDDTEIIHSLSQYDLAVRPINNSQEILRYVPGLFIGQHAGGGKAEQIFLRGFDIDHGTDISISVDGMPVNMPSHAHGQGYSDLHFLIPETIQRVDFNKGPHYAEYGDFTTAGYVSFKTRDAVDHNTIKVEGGQYGTFRTVGMFNLLGTPESDEDDQLFVAGEVFGSDGYFESSQGFRRYNVMAKYKSQWNPNTLFTATGSTFYSKWTASGQIPVRAVESGQITRYGAIDDTEGGETARTNLNLQLVQDLKGATWSNQLYYSRYDFNLVSNFTFFLNDPVNGDQITQSETRDIIGYKSEYKRSDYLGSIQLQSKAGATMRYDHVDDIRLSRTKDRQEVLSDIARGDVNQSNVSAYIGESIALLPQLVLDAELRYDHLFFNYTNRLDATDRTEDKGIWSPKARLNYQLSPNLSFFVKAGTGFHSNDARVVVAQSGEEILPKAYGQDIGMFYKPASWLAINLTTWNLDLDQEFVYVGDEGVVEAGGKTNRKGVDLSVRAELTSWLFADVDLNYTKARSIDEPEAAQYIPLAPVFTSIGGLSFDFEQGWNGSVRYRYLGDRAANEDRSVIAEGYFIMDAVVNYTQPKYQVSLTVENLLNQEWKETQFLTESRLEDEPAPVEEIHFTPGTPFFAKFGFSYFF